MNTKKSTFFSKYWNHTFLSNRFFYILGGLSIISILGFLFPIFYKITIGFLIILSVFIVLDYLILFLNSKIIGRRIVSERFSNFDENKVIIEVENHYFFTVSVTIFEELPYQFHIRTKSFFASIPPKKKTEIIYYLTPTERGEYTFGNLNIMTSSILGLIKRKYKMDAQTQIAVYPSFLNLSKFDFNNIRNFTREHGTKKYPKIGNSQEFEHIKEYNIGDDFRHINWKASAKKNSLMVNRFQEEKSQQIYCIIDSGRMMEMPFDGLSILDYAINSSLIFSNLVLKKQDKIGLIHFNKKVEFHLPPEKYNTQLGKILNGLYNIKTEFSESDFGNLYNEIKYKINKRSLLLLFTNFEDLNSMHRQLPYLKAIAKNHILVVIFFLNKELEQLITNPRDNFQHQVAVAVAEKFLNEKKVIENELKKHGIIAILTLPKNLSVNVINTYLDVKAKGLF
jgi:uncharacterized protein (DUF58 family)